MKIITWNINGYRSITGQNPSKKYDKVTKVNKLFEFVKNEKPDILALQEIKADVSQINKDLIAPEDYYYFYNTCKIKKGYSGVATFSKIKPLRVNDKMGIDKFDLEGRFLELHYDNFIHFNIYFPKGYTDHERLDYKLEFYDSFYNYLKRIMKNKKNIIISGDFNTAHTPIDLARPEENINTSGFLEIERKKLDELIAINFVDSFRLFNKEGGHYSWWSQRGRARENNVGWRIDYNFISNNIVNKTIDSYHITDQGGSDHCPVVLEINL